ncbi:efflux RND transporter periplasmic adaptor subunit [Rhodoferax sp.]|uniref:efflux RND transporter periplasmic adaptor subunit n=1 Tax=Rhodoferax sp. TaxID=50421 RepID=UPI00284B421B|nr:efflux RND transporter periplasmic adaptor subunit [Rhodoferax sp.]MDR3369822.1 efflux RND transporter periplasmic adaptor subunit [Rhodoferax sp.]
MNIFRPYCITVCALAALASLALSGCSDKPAAPVAAGPASAASGAAPGASPPVSVTTVQAKKQDMAVNLQATGTVVPLTSVDVKTQVTSTILQVHFKEGQFVKAGQLLFTLDARADEANAAKSRAQLAKDNASLSDAKRQLARAQQLLAQNFVSQGAVDTAQALVDSWAATLVADQAAITANNVALSYDRITSPQSGRAGAVNVYAGSAVQANQTTLVTITQLDPIGVAFSVPQRNLTSALSALKDGGAEVSATLADGGGSFKGRLQFMDNLVDANSGTVKAKAVFANPEGKLWPGAFVEVSQTVATLQQVVVVPQAAIIETLRGSVVYVVVDGKAILRPVKVIHAERTDAAVTGVLLGDSVVTEGKQNVRPNAAVKERPADAKSEVSGAAKPAKPVKP